MPAARKAEKEIRSIAFVSLGCPKNLVDSERMLGLLANDGLVVTSDASSADAIIINHHVNIGVAVAVEDGLVVPVLNFTDQMTLTQIGSSVKDLAGKAKAKKLQPSEMEGSTFTVSNLGMFGIQSFTSIINQPNSAILSVGAIEEKPVVRNGQIVVGNTMMLTLACDHRTVDGATGAQFLQTLRQYLENPVTMLA